MDLGMWELPYLFFIHLFNIKFLKCFLKEILPEILPMKVYFSSISSEVKLFSKNVVSSLVQSTCASYPMYKCTLIQNILSHCASENAFLLLILWHILAIVWMWTTYLMHLNRLRKCALWEVLRSRGFSLMNVLMPLKGSWQTEFVLFWPYFCLCKDKSSPSLIDSLKALSWKHRTELTRHQLCWPDSGLGSSQHWEKINFGSYFNKPHIL